MHVYTTYHLEIHLIWCCCCCVHTSLTQHFLHGDLFDLTVVCVRQLSKQCYEPQNNCLHAHIAHKLALTRSIVRLLTH